jgi:hypothetical protein
MNMPTQDSTHQLVIEIERKIARLGTIASVPDPEPYLYAEVVTTGDEQRIDLELKRAKILKILARLQAQ